MLSNLYHTLPVRSQGTVRCSGSEVPHPEGYPRLAFHWLCSRVWEWALMNILRWPQNFPCRELSPPFLLPILSSGQSWGSGQGKSMLTHGEQGLGFVSGKSPLCARENSFLYLLPLPSCSETKPYLGSHPDPTAFAAPLDPKLMQSLPMPVII